MKKINLKLEDNFPGISATYMKSLWEQCFPVDRPREVFTAIAAAISAIWTTLSTTGVYLGAGLMVSWAGLIKAAVVVGLAAWSMSASKAGGTNRPTLDSNAQLVNSRQSNQVIPVAYGVARVGGNWVFSRPSGVSNAYSNFVVTWSEGPVAGIANAIDFTTVFDGTGINDLKTGGAFTAPNYLPVKYRVKIDGIGTPNTFCWSDDGGSSWDATLVPITANEWQTLNNGVQIMFENATEHGNNDIWDFTAGLGVWTGERLIHYYKPYSGDDLAYHSFHHGTAGQHVDSSLQGETQEWKDPLRYTAYSYFKLTASAAWRGIPDFTILLRGRLLYDPRDGSTAYSNNPALVWRDWLTNARYGLGIPESMIDDDSVEDVANWCDAHGYTFNGVVLERKDFLDHLEDIMLNFKAYMVYLEGIYYLKIFAEDAAVLTLTENDVEISPESFGFSIPGLDDSFTKAKVTFADAEENYSANTLQWPKTEIVSNPAILEGEASEKTLTGTNSKTQAKKIAKFGYMKGQFDTQFSILGHSRCIALLPGDIIQITHEFPGWTMHRVRIKDVGYPQYGLIPLSLTDEDASIHDETV